MLQSCKRIFSPRVGRIQKLSMSSNFRFYNSDDIFEISKKLENEREEAIKNFKQLELNSKNAERHITKENLKTKIEDDENIDPILRSKLRQQTIALRETEFAIKRVIVRKQILQEARNLHEQKEQHMKLVEIQTKYENFIQRMVSKEGRNISIPFTSSGDSFSPTFLTHLLYALKRNTTVEEITIDSNVIFEQHGVEWTEIVKENNTLKRISLKSNQISNASTIAFIESLKNNHTIEIVNFGGNINSDEGVLALSELLKINKGIKTLDFGGDYSDRFLNFDPMCPPIHHKISDNGAIALSDALKMNQTLKQLKGREYSISDQGALKYINDALKTNTSLEKLSLSYYVFDRQMRPQIQAYI